MYLSGKFMRRVLFAFLLVIIFAPVSFAASATADARARINASEQAAANLGAGGPGSDLRAISSPKKAQTLTGFPDGTLPGSDMGGGSGNYSGGNYNSSGSRVVMSGEPLPPAIGSDMVGSKLDKVSVVAAHMGYTVVRVGFSPTVMDMPYTYAVMNGKRKISTLYLNRSMVLVMAQ